MRDGRLREKVILVTGAARGIGEAIAHACHAEGARVIASDLRHEAGRETAARLGPRARYLPLDVREEQAWERAVEDVLTHEGHLDGLVNNAGITGLEEGGGPADPERETLGRWRAVHRTNLEGVFLGCRAALRAMRPRGSGSIVNVSSRSGMVGIPGAAAYASSKAAVRNHTKSVALHCAAEGLAIRCNSIHPGAILTPMWEALLGTGPEREERLRAFTRDTPLHRFGRPEEVAALAVFLLSDECPYATGAEWHVDGGLTAGAPAAPAAPEE
jgi:NAD(P)-dependent dehydrogenase (short-subunit alcohol dehydrogenase family)